MCAIRRAVASGQRPSSRLSDRKLTGGRPQVGHSHFAPMHDLTNWDTTDEFTATEAASLIVGFDPNDPAAPQFKAQPILREIAEGHRVARAMFATPITADEFRRQRASRFFEHALVSVLFDAFPLNQKVSSPGDPDCIYELPRHLRGMAGELAQQHFARAEIARWLGVKGIESKYKFASAPKAAPPPTVERAAGPLTSEEIAEIINAHRDGESAVSIAKRYGKTRQSIDKIIKAHREPSGNGIASITKSLKKRVR